MMTVLYDLGSALTTSLASNGQTPVVGNFDWGGYNITNLGTVGATAIAVGNLTASGVIAAANGTTGSQVVNISQFPVTLASPGTQTIPGGLIMKWGTGSTTSGVGAVSYAAAFPTGVLNVQLTISAGTAEATLSPLILGASIAAGFDVWGDASESLAFNWLAIGY
jgi:hypothetical protein